MAVIEFKIAYPPEGKQKNGWCKKYGLNKYWAGVHWAVRKSDTDYWHMLVTSALNAIHLPEAALPLDVPVLIFFYWNDGLDIDNHAAMGKMIVDSLKHRIIKDDNRRNLKGVFHLWHDQGNYIRIVIKPLKNIRKDNDNEGI